MKTKYWIWVIIACILFFIAGIFINRIFFTVNIYPLSSNSALTFSPPQIPLPIDWPSKENQPGNSFSSSLELQTGITTQGTLNNNNVLDYYYFTIKDPSQIIVDVTDLPKAFYWGLYNDKYQNIAYTYRTGTSEGSTKVALENPGKYYIKVWADYTQLTNYPYTIRLNILPYFD